jgi:hypothetical protein
VEDALRKIPGAQVETYAIGGAIPDSFFDGFESGCIYTAHTDNQTPPAPRWCRKGPAPRMSAVLHGDPQGQSVVIALGTNLLWGVGQPGGWERAKASLWRMASYAREHAERCYWIGPPDMRVVPKSNLAQLYTLLAELPCELIDSRAVAQYPATGGDGCHYGGDPEMDRLGAVWGQGVAAKLLEKVSQIQH